MKRLLIFLVMILVITTMLVGCTDSGQAGKITVVSDTVEINKNIKSINVLADIGNITVKLGDKISVDYENIIKEWLTITEVDEILEIKYIPPKEESLKGIDTTKHSIILYVTSQIYEDFTINAGTGKLYAEGVRCKNLKISYGTGNAECKSLIADNMMIDSGSSDLTAENINVTNKTDIDLSVGKVKLEGDLTGVVNIEGGMGSANITFRKSVDEYTIQCQNEFNTVFIDGSVFESNIYHGSNKINIDEGMSEVYLNFAK